MGPYPSELLFEKFILNQALQVCLDFLRIKDISYEQAWANKAAWINQK